MHRIKLPLLFIIIEIVISSCTKIVSDCYYPLEGKNIVCFGASNTERGHYVELLSDFLGGTFYNVGIGGSGICQRPLSSERMEMWDKMNMYNLVNCVCKDDFDILYKAADYLLDSDNDDFRSQIRLLDSIDFNDIDILLVSYGGNEYNNNTKIGEIDSYEVSSVMGAMNYCFSKLYESFPNIHIMFYSGTYRWLTLDGKKDTDNTPNDVGLYTIDYANAMVKVAEQWHIPSINMVNECGFNKYNHHLYFVDGSHYNEEGGKFFASRLSAWIRSVYFFIGN